MLDGRVVAAAGAGAGVAEDPSADATVGASAVPVALHVGGQHREAVARLVEGALGWPVVDARDPMTPPVAAVVDVDAMTASPWRGPATVPVVLLVAEDDDATAAAVAGTRAGTVLAWPPDAEALRRAVLDHAGVASTRPWCTLAAAAGGVGATTVALALAGVHAWRSGRALAAVSGPAHVAAPPVAAAEDLASPAAWVAGAAVPGIPGLRVVALRSRATLAPAGGDVPAVVDVGSVGVDDGVGPVPDVLVVRPDRRGLAAVEATPATVVVAVGTGPARPRDLVAASRQRELVRLRHDPRVASACHRHRHPTDAPGAWLRPLDGVVALLGGPGTHTGDRA